MKEKYLMIKEAIPAKHRHLITVLFIPYLMMLFGGIAAIVTYSFKEPLRFFAELFISFGVTALLMILFSLKADKRTLPSLGLTKKGIIKDNLLGFFLGVLMIVLAIIIMLLTGNASIMSSRLTPEILKGVLFVLPAWMVQGFSEEVMVRGYMFPTLSNRYGLKVGLFVSAAYFALLHILNPNITVLGIINILLVGIIFTLMVMVHDNLWVASGFHVGWNYAQAHLVGIPVSGMQVGESLTNFSVRDSIVTGGSFGIEGGLICTFLLLALGFIYVLLLRKKNMEFKEYNDKRKA